MSVSLSVDGPGDAELISAVRGGDSDAYGELFARHVDAARRLARQLAGHADADDLVSDAFTKVLTVLQRGGGPDLAFRAYLLTAVRRLHVDRIRAGSRLRPVDDLTPFDPGLPFQDTAVEGFDNAAAARAFSSLPERWQMVLWHTEVEQQKPGDIAPLLGMSANSVSALAYRAREGLRQAFLSQHATDPDDVDCAWTRDHLGAYVRGGLSRRDAARVDDHLAACRACAAVYLELTEVNSGLAGLLAPLLLGSAGASYLTSTGAGSSVLSTTLTTAKTWVAAHAPMTAVGGMVVAASAVLSIYGATHLGGGHDGGATLGSPQLNRAPVSSIQPSDPGAGNGQHDRHGSHHGRNDEGPGRNASLPPSTPPSSTPPSTPPVTNESTAPPVNPPTDPTTLPTDPTTGPGQPEDVSFDSQAPDNPAIGSTYQVSARGGSGGPITFSVTHGTTNDACSLSGHLVTFDHAGTCVVTAQEGGDSRGAARGGATKATQTIAVPQTQQKVSFDTKTPNEPRVEGTYDAAATSTSGRHVTLAIGDGTTNAACSLAGSSVSFDHPGTCELIATQAGDADLAPDMAVQTFGVDKGLQAITLTPSPASNTVVGDTFAVTGGRSANAVEVQTTGEVCAYVDGTLTMLNPGTCLFTATQKGNDDYADGFYATSMNVLPQSADLFVTAEITSELQNGTRVTATIHNLPAGAQATVTVTPEGNYELKPVDNGGVCRKTGPASYICTVTGVVGADPTLKFDVNVHNGEERVVDFLVAPMAPLTDDNDENDLLAFTLND